MCVGTAGRDLPNIGVGRPTAGCACHRSPTAAGEARSPQIRRDPPTVSRRTAPANPACPYWGRLARVNEPGRSVRKPHRGRYLVAGAIPRPPVSCLFHDVRTVLELEVSSNFAAATRVTGVRPEQPGTVHDRTAGYSTYGSYTPPAPDSRRTGRNVLVVAPQPFYEDRGTPIAVRRLLEALSELAYNVDVLTYPVGRDLELPGVRVLRTANPFGLRRV